MHQPRSMGRTGPASPVRAVALVAVVIAGLLNAACGSSSATAEASATASPTPVAATDSPSPIVTPSQTPSPSASPGTDWVYSDLDGVAAPANLAHRLPLAIMIDDNARARPQSGFSSASIVYQAMADGGEDRYMLVFQEGTATDIGPVRSGRPYFVYWASEYKPLFGHYGGDAETLQVTIPALSGAIYNMDALGYNMGSQGGGSCPYHRILTRVAPHNAYTNTASLVGCSARIGYPDAYQGMPTRTFVDPSAAAALPASQSISIPYRTGVIGYQFDPASDTYKRLVAGSLQVDPANGAQVRAANVVVMFQSYKMEPSLDHLRPVVGNVGSGTAIVFKEGRAVAATWKKTSQTALTRFYDSNGKEIPLLRGQIFIQSVPIGTAVTYT